MEQSALSFLSGIAQTGAGLFIIAGVIIAGFILIAYLIVSKTSGKDDSTAILQLHQQIESIREQVNSSIERTTGVLNTQLDGINKRVDENMKASLDVLSKSNETFSSQLQHTTKSIESVQGAIQKLEESNRRIYDIGKDIASLQDLLKPPKLRGILGELSLEMVLKDILPQGAFEMQHRFRSGEAVDAVIRLGERMVPVDSKFPLEDFKRLSSAENDEQRKSAAREFRRAVKKHIDDISKKYIRPEEGTYDFAFMYVQAENVYYEIIVRDEEGDDKGVQNYAMNKRVVPVSPNSFYAYLFTVALGLKGMQIEKHAQEVMSMLGMLSKELGKFKDDFNTLGSHIRNSAAKYDSADKKLSVIDARLGQIAEGEPSSGRISEGNN